MIIGSYYIGSILSRDSQIRGPKFPKLKLLWVWGPIFFCTNLWLRWGLNKSCSLHWELSNDVSHITWTQGNWGDSWLLVVGSQIVNLTPGPSFGHNLCFKHLNESCKPIWDIYVPRSFQWYKELFNLMGFVLKIWESIRTLIPKVGAHLGVRRFIPSHSPTFLGVWDLIFGLPSWLAPLQTFALVASSKIRSQQFYWWLLLVILL